MSSAASTSPSSPGGSSSNEDPGIPTNPLDDEPDVLGIYTGPEADAVLHRSHVLWEGAARAARESPRGEFPDSVFELERLLQRIPALPSAIPPDDPGPLEGYSTWENSTSSCSLRIKNEYLRTVALRAMKPYTVFLSSSESFQRWSGTENNGVVLLILGWAYVLNATIAEAQGLPLELHQYPSPTQGTSLPGSCAPLPPPADQRIPLDLSYAEPEELEWWKSLITPGLSLSVVGSQEYLPFSLDVANLGSLDLGSDRYSDKTPSGRLPSAIRAAEYLQNLSFAYNLGPQVSAALAAALCFRVKRVDRTLSVPRPTLEMPRNTKTRSNKKLRERYGRVPGEFSHLRHYIILGLCNNLLPVTLESLFWDPLVPCNHAGHWIRPMRRFLGPAILSGDWELLARTIAPSSAAASPLWLGVLLCGESPSLIGALEHYAWYG